MFFTSSSFLKELKDNTCSRTTNPSLLNVHFLSAVSEKVSHLENMITFLFNTGQQQSYAAKLKQQLVNPLETMKSLYDTIPFKTVPMVTLQIHNISYRGLFIP